MSDTHMNGGAGCAGVRGQIDYKAIGVIIAMLALALILFVIVRGMLRGLG